MVVAVAGNVDHATVVRQVRKAFSRCDFLADTSVRPLPVAPRRARPAYVDRGRGRRAARSSRSTWCSGSTGWCAPTTVATRSACSTPRSAAARPRGCSRRSASAAGWPTPSTPTPRTTPTPARSRSPSAACPRRSPRCWPWSRGELGRLADDGISDGRAAARQGPAARRAGARRSRTPARGCRGSPRPSCSTTSCPASTRCSQRVDDVTLEDVNTLARDLFRSRQTLAVVGPFDALPA